jgi:hypothetical protein
MTAPGRIETADTSLTRDVLYAVRYYLGGRRGLLILGGVALVGGLAFNWSWLVAVGIAPLLIAALPCVAMCALGLCMSRMSGQSCSTNAAPETKAAPTTEDMPTEVRAVPEDISLARPADAPLSDLAGAPAPESQPVKERSHTDA